MSDEEIQNKLVYRVNFNLKGIDYGYIKNIFTLTRNRIGKKWDLLKETKRILRLLADRACPKENRLL